MPKFSQADSKTMYFDSPKTSAEQWNKIFGEPSPKKSSEGANAPQDVASEPGLCWK